MPINAKILEQLKVCDPSVIVLDLNHHSVTADDISILAAAIEGNPYLEEIHLSDNDIRDEGASLLAQAIRSCPNLWFLDISASCISDEGIEQVLSVPQLRYLNISSNSITDCSAEKILVNGNILSVSFGCNEISPSLRDEIDEYLKYNQQKFVEDFLFRAKEIFTELDQEHKEMLSEKVMDILFGHGSTEELTSGLQDELLRAARVLYRVLGGTRLMWTITEQIRAEIMVDENQRPFSPA